MNYTQAQIDRANAVSLEDFLRTQGETLIKSGREYRWKEHDSLQKIKFEKPRAKYKAEHEAELIQFYAARRKLTGEFPDGKVDMKKLSDEYDELEQAHNTTYGEFKTVRDDLHRLWKVKSCVDTAARFNERTEEQKLQNRPQTRQKKEDMTR